VRESEGGGYIVKPEATKKQPLLDVYRCQNLRSSLLNHQILLETSRKTMCASFLRVSSPSNKYFGIETL
jgi:hypothetical protein